MAYTIRRADYFYATVHDDPGQGYQLLTQLAALGINLLGFTGMPAGLNRTQLTIFPEDPAAMVEAGKNAGLVLDGPHSALLVQGDDELGAWARIHQKLYEAKVDVYASAGLADVRGAYGYLLYIRPEHFDNAVKALGV